MRNTVNMPVVGPNVKLSLPPEIALSFPGSNPQWACTSGKCSRDISATSSAKASEINEQDDNVSYQPTDDNVPNKDTGLDEFGLPIGDWEDFLMDITAQDL